MRKLFLLIFAFPLTVAAQQPANLYNFGALGDGTTDDTTAVSNWLAYCNSNGVACYAPAGQFVVTNSISTAKSVGLVVFGDGYTKTKFVNKASAGKPTFLFDGAQYFVLRDLAILGKAGFPNEAIKVRTSTDASPVPAGFGEFVDLLLCPNGNGLHFDGTIQGAVAGINSFGVRHVKYWPSGFNGGATTDTSTRKYGIIADGSGLVNDAYIDDFNAVGVEKTIAGHACIKWATTLFSFHVVVRNCELEGVDLKAVDFSKVFDFSIVDSYVENANLKFTNSRYGRIKVFNPGNSSTGEKAIDIYTGVQIVVEQTDSNGTFRVDSASQDCGLIASTFNDVSNSGERPTVVSGIVGTGSDSLTGGILGTRLPSETLYLANGVRLSSAAYSPNGNVPGCVGSIFTNTAGGAGAVLYVKESGGCTNTGWVAK